MISLVVCDEIEEPGEPGKLGSCCLSELADVTCLIVDDNLQCWDISCQFQGLFGEGHHQGTFVCVLVSGDPELFSVDIDINHIFCRYHDDRMINYDTSGGVNVSDMLDKW